MRKSIIKGVFVALMMILVTGTVSAQVFLQRDRDDIAPRVNNGTDKEWIIVPIQGYDFDQYAFTPIGSGTLLLASLGAGYALLRRKKGSTTKEGSAK